MLQALRRSFLPSAAIHFLFLTTAWAQQTQLRIVVIEGQDALNNTQLSANRDVIVEIRGSDQALLSGAAVTFTYPAQGASGTFPNGMRSAMVTTNMEGRAIATGVRPIGGTGTLQLRVSASYMGRTATAVISQTNVAALAAPPKPVPATSASPSNPSTSSAPIGPPAKKPGMSKTTKILLILAIAGGAAAGAVVATRSGGSGSSSSTSPPIVITPGTPTVGGPR